MLASLPEAEYRRLEPYLNLVQLSRGEQIQISGEVIEQVYFIESGVVSSVIILENGSMCEAGLIGNEGVVGYSAFLGNSSNLLQALVQVEGSAITLPTEVLNTEFARGGQFQQLLLRFTLALMTQVSYTNVASSFFPIEARLARWLLMVEDRVREPRLPITQELLASMLGVRRASISATANSLKEAGIINYSRGRIQILDRQRLETLAGETYTQVRDEYIRLLGYPSPM